MIDRIAKIVLIACSIAAAIGFVGVLKCYNWGFFLAFGAMALANIPMVHFALDWPIEKAEKMGGQVGKMRRAKQAKREKSDA